MADEVGSGLAAMVSEIYPARLLLDHCPTCSRTCSSPGGEDSMLFPAAALFAGLWTFEFMSTWDGDDDMQYIIILNFC